jgi:hypothetical protein
MSENRNLKAFFYQKDKIMDENIYYSKKSVFCILVNKLI